VASTADPGRAPEGAARAPEDTASGVRDAAGRPPARSRARGLAGWAAALLVAVALALGLRTYVFGVFSIPTSSMESTLGIGDRILVWKAFFNWHDVHQGDIVVFTHPPLDHCPGPADTDLVKRVVALPGQTIYSLGGNIYVDGRRLPEPYLPPHEQPGPPIPQATSQAPFHVPPGEFYVMGDNRQISCDSRFWGPIKGTSIVGKAVVLVWHHSLPDFHLF
jgi:signal peptidase I